MYSRWDANWPWLCVICSSFLIGFVVCIYYCSCDFWFCAVSRGDGTLLLLTSVQHHTARAELIFSGQSWSPVEMTSELPGSISVSGFPGSASEWELIWCWSHSTCSQAHGHTLVLERHSWCVWGRVCLRLCLLGRIFWLFHISSLFRML